MKKLKDSFYSQFGEDVVIAKIFDAIGTTNKWCLEVGAAAGIALSNTRHFIEEGWKAVLIEGSAKKYEALKKNSPDCLCFCTLIQTTGVDSLDGILDFCHAPKVIDLLSLDIDGQEWHIWKNFKEHSARVMVVEYAPYVWWQRGGNAIKGMDPNYIVPLGKKGQSGLDAMKTLADEKGYKVVKVTDCNIICVQKELEIPCL